MPNPAKPLSNDFITATNEKKPDGSVHSQNGNALFLSLSFTLLPVSPLLATLTKRGWGIPPTLARKSALYCRSSYSPPAPSLSPGIHSGPAAAAPLVSGGLFEL